MQLRVTEPRIAEREKGRRQVRVVRVSLARENILLGGRNKPARAEKLRNYGLGSKASCYMPPPFSLFLFKEPR